VRTQPQLCLPAKSLTFKFAFQLPLFQNKCIYCSALVTKFYLRYKQKYVFILTTNRTLLIKQYIFVSVELILDFSFI